MILRKALTRKFRGRPLWVWLLLAVVVAAVVAVAIYAWRWAALSLAVPALLGLGEVMRRAPSPADADEASGRAVQVSTQADAREAALQRRHREIREEIASMSDEELARELERTRRPR